MINCASLLIRYLDVYEISAMTYLNLNIQVYQRCDAVLLQFRKVANDSVRTDVLYIILLEFGIPIKVVRLIKMCLKSIADSG
jgi:hypothetical protein